MHSAIRQTIESLRILTFALALIVPSACQGPNAGYLQNGIGSELSASDIATATKTQNLYFSHLCAQAGAAASCSAIPSIDRTAWTMIARQGMNDIDRRCDAYLQWLDDKKRSRAPILSEVRDLNSATVAIVGALDPSNGIALQVLAASFNLITRSIDNYHSRLLLEVDSSTINSVVLRARNDFRVNTRMAYYDTRPDAEYVLRSYLRLCLPFSIETNINNYTTLAAQGIRVDSQNSINTFPSQVIGPFAGGVERRFSSTGAFPPDPLPKALNGSITTWEKALQPNDLRTIQEYLCVREPASRFGANTRAAINIWREASTGSRDPKPLDSREGATLLSTAKKDGECANEHFRNIYERIHLGKPETEVAFIAKLATAVNRSVDAPAITTLSDARGLIAQYLTDHPEYTREGFGSDEVNPTMFKRIQSQ
ncbi:hypothetical protein [Rhizobium leguminosarum]|uniref:hypothetical protein n=1 Tax=Rhizobium leguminosarum TaxID=384 RepID=UPI001C98AA9A|nr:hypothetical protein [Rhizobium leguminosarum]MBY5664532.1 hypothetical protein [Rhizobium leguminosarum]MBY5677782.1 hypothetical protein [Rhizobium leguminosarum]